MRMALIPSPTLQKGSKEQHPTRRERVTNLLGMGHVLPVPVPSALRLLQSRVVALLYLRSS